jgi:threonine dehydratase
MSTPRGQGVATAGRPAADAATGVNRQAIVSVAALIRPYLRRTPVIRVDRADFGLPPGPLVLKLGQLQHTGSFKARGAFANLLLRDIPEAGVVAASGGNHGVAVSYAARVLGVPARIYVPGISSAAKIARIRGNGAHLVIAGDTYADALAGIAAGYEGRARIVGAEPEEAPTLTRALRAGRPVDAPAGGLAADSLAPKRIGELNFAILTRHAAQAVEVSDDAIRQAQELLWDRLRLVAEPGGCAALAALTTGGYTPAPGERVAAVISGANTTAVSFRQ